jgi:hypothetical protein
VVIEICIKYRWGSKWDISRPLMYLRVCMNIGSRMPYVSDLDLDSTPLYT